MSETKSDPYQWQPSLRQLLRGGLEILLDTVRLVFVRKTPVEIASGREKIRGAIYYPEGNQPAPAVLLLHTAYGLTVHEHVMAARLAREGYVALVVAYSRRTTGKIIQDKLRIRQLEQIVLDVWYFLGADKRVDVKRSAIVGLSLGGYFATFLATKSAEFVPTAAVIYYGVYPLTEWNMDTLTVPMLVLQGGKDSLFFVENAQQAQVYAHAHNKPVEVIHYPTVGHEFDLFEPDSSATAEAWSQTLAFLRQQLNA